MFSDLQQHQRNKIYHTIKEIFNKSEKPVLQIIKVQGLSVIQNKYCYTIADNLLNVIYDELNNLYGNINIIQYKWRTYILITSEVEIDENIAKINEIEYKINTIVKALLHSDDIVTIKSITVLPKDIDMEMMDSECFFNVFFSEIELFLKKEPSVDCSNIIFNKEKLKKIKRDLKIKSKLKFALENRVIKFNFQPQVARSGVVVGYESLARWHDEELGVIPPLEFIPLYEQGELGVLFGQYAIKESLIAFKEILNNKVINSNKTPTLSINIMMHHFLDERFYDYIIEIAKKLSIPPKLITLEITETDVGVTDCELGNIFTRLRDAGFKISIDDFGTGNSSFYRLVQLDFDELKLDKAFVDKLSQSEPDKNRSKVINIINSISSFCYNHDIQLVIEGVETLEQKKLICQAAKEIIIQGYLYSKPLSLKDVLDYPSTKISQEVH